MLEKIHNINNYSANDRTEGETTKTLSYNYKPAHSSSLLRSSTDDDLQEDPLLKWRRLKNERRITIICWIICSSQDSMSDGLSPYQLPPTMRK
jgi:hypothetical protein